jgi:hypothetical protein
MLTLTLPVNANIVAEQPAGILLVGPVPFISGKGGVAELRCSLLVQDKGLQTHHSKRIDSSADCLNPVVA